MKKLLHRVSGWYYDHYMLVGYGFALALIVLGFVLGFRVRAILFPIFLILGFFCGYWHTPLSQF